MQREQIKQYVHKWAKLNLYFFAAIYFAIVIYFSLFSLTTRAELIASLAGAAAITIAMKKWRKKKIVDKR